eukprot:Hpha_TRINITY_DN30648_c0_g1::TRINITY_DN30648_c0_g1_i1::g.18215::m.18215/K03372/ACATN, SLC33A1; MFS transporter, PAT family, solute carrier family 33 (acetyl-CoA transportor), member 1
MGQGSGPERRRKCDMEEETGAEGKGSRRGQVKWGCLPAEDAGSVMFLLLLYTLQGLPMGLCSAMPMLLKDRGVSLSAIGTFSLVTWPFSLKLIWAPIVDTVYSPRFGRRKSWLVPAQLLIGAIMLVVPAERLLDNADVVPLTVVFGLLYFLCATQDIAVDGWALSMLSRENVGWAATTNVVGQTFGYCCTFTGFLGLRHYGVVTLDGFLQTLGGVFTIVTICVWALRHESSPDAEDTETPVAVFRQVGALSKLPSVRRLLLLLLVWKAPFAPADVISGLKLQEKGMPKEHIALMATSIVPVTLLMPFALLSITASVEPLRAARYAYLPRIVVTALAAVVVAVSPGAEAGPGFYAVVYVLLVLREILSSTIFVAQMSLFARISDPAIGGTYMTALNTAANLGSAWSSTAALKVTDALTLGDGWFGSGLDGFYVLSVIASVGGLVWFVVMGREEMVKLDRAPMDNWRVQPGIYRRQDVTPMV